MKILLPLYFMVSLSACGTGTYFNDASVHLGAYDGLGTAVLCDDRSGDDEYLTNVGLESNLYQSSGDRVRLNATYDYYSCTWGSDNKGFETVGLELEYKFFSRN